MLKRFLTILISVVFTLSIGKYVVASSGLSVSGAKVDTDVSPGEYIHTMTVSIGDESPPTNISVEVNGFAQQLNGALQSIPLTKDSSVYSISHSINLNTERFHLEPGESKKVEAKFQIPPDIGDGGRYAVIRMYTSPEGNGTTNIVSAVAIPIYLTIKDSQLIHNAKISEVTTGELASGKPVDVYTTFQNTGNHHFKAKGEVTVSDASGRVLDTLYTTLTPSSIIPTMFRQLKASFVPEGELPIGVYTIKSKVMMEDGTLLNEATGSFEIKAPYVPPPPAAEITLKPSSAATLNTSDGRIFINFPQGAVLGEAQLSLQSFPPEQLPAPPAGSKLGTTCFRVDGLNGLLTKEAKISVRYSSADLERAEGDASRLQLARWDEASNSWMVFKTIVDEDAMTLTTTTNQFSLWAVIIGSPSSPSAPFNPVLYAVIGGIAGIIIAGLILGTMRRKKVAGSKKL
jgi:hypothetical protein